jgi:hypothetical protein
LLSRLNVIAVIGITLVDSAASELSRAEGNAISSMDKVIHDGMLLAEVTQDAHSGGGEMCG